MLFFQRCCWMLVLVYSTMLASSCSDPRLIDQSLPQSHKAENSGTTRVEIPEVYELAQIVYALGEQKHGSQSRIWTKGRYYEQIQSYFGPYQNHPAVDAVYFEKWPDYWSYRQNSLAFQLERESIVSGNVYDRLWSAGANQFEKAIPLLEDFARESQIQSFFEENGDYYEALISEFSDIAGPDAMKAWLEKNFSARYDSYFIVISPLVGGAHNFAIVRDTDYAEALITISAPNIMDEYRTDSGKIAEDRSLRFVRTIFTELDHNYINPVSERYKRKIDNAIGDVNQLNESDDYRSKLATFNEYVTWAIYPLFVADIYGDEKVAISISDVDSVMVSRGFVKFPEFNAWVHERFSGEMPASRFEDRYDELLDWFRENS